MRERRQRRKPQFPGLRDYLEQRFGTAARKALVRPIAPGGVEIKEGGYGLPHLVSWKEGAAVRRLVLETVRPGEFGHEDRGDRAGIVVRALDDYEALPRHVRVVGAGALRKGGAAPLENTGEFFLLTEFAAGESYARDLAAIAESGGLEAIDRERARALADYLSAIHAEPVRHPTYYRRRLRDLAGSGECLAGIADSYPVPFGFVTAELLEAVERLALSWRYRLRDRDHRLRVIHGDFHPWNLLFRQGTDFSVLDRSRGAWGDPADDVAALSINYLFFALRTRGAFVGPFAELFEIFWERYLALSGDANLGEVIAPHFAFRALVLAHPRWYPKEAEETRRALFRFLLAVMEAERFEPACLPAYLSRTGP
jgi:hypothetical protein